MSNSYLVLIHAVSFDWSFDLDEEPSFEVKKAALDKVMNKAIQVPIPDNIGEGIDSSIADVISDMTGWCVRDFEYHIAGVVGDDYA